MSQYKTGTATFTNGSSTVTGTGTAWLSNLSAGDYIVRRGDALNTFQAYQIGGTTNDTTLTLTAPYGGDTASGVEYVAHIDFLPNGAPKFDNADIETASILNAHLTKLESIENLGTAAYLDAQTSQADSTANRVMLTGGGGILAENASFTGIDLDNFTVGQLFYATPSSTNKPSGATGGCVLVKPSSGDTLVQEWDDVLNEERYIRTIFSDTPGEWVKQYGSNNIIGTVSESGGVPTGAIFQSIPDTGNGSAVLLADGTAWITRYSVSSFNVNVASGSIFTSAEQTLTTPVTLVGDFRVMCGDAASTIVWGLGQRLTSTTYNIRLLCYASVTNRPASIVIKGRWY